MAAVALWARNLGLVAHFLATIAPDALDNWQLAKANGVWGVRESGAAGKTGTANARRVAPGDALYIWRSKGRDARAIGGIIAKAEVIGPFQTLAEGAKVPWPNRAAYLGSFPIQLVGELANPVPDRFVNRIGVESGIENIALIHGFREITNEPTIDWIEKAFDRS